MTHSLDIKNMEKIVLVCLFFSFFTTSSITPFTLLGYIFMAILYVLSLLSLLSERIVTKRTFLMMVFILGVLVFLVINSNYTLSNLVSVLQIFLIFSVVRYTQQLDFNQTKTFDFRRINLFFMLVLYILAFMRLYLNIDIMFHNYASIAPITMCMIIFNFMLYKTTENYRMINFLGYFPLLLLCNGRNAILCTALFLIYFRFINVKRNTGKALIFFLLVLVVYLITVQYPLLYHTPLGNKLDALSVLYTHKNFFSGRQLIWRNILGYMDGYKLFGYGTGTLYNMLSGDSRSAHNQYLQLYMQNGLVGLSILFFVLYIVWSKIIFNKNNSEYNSVQFYRCRISESFFPVMIIYNIFSVSMLQNSMATANFFWFILALGAYNTSFYNTKETRLT